jgi:hypothetical protein
MPPEPDAMRRYGANRENGTLRVRFFPEMFFHDAVLGLICRQRFGWLSIFSSGTSAISLSVRAVPCDPPVRRAASFANTHICLLLRILGAEVRALPRRVVSKTQASISMMSQRLQRGPRSQAGMRKLMNVSTDMPSQRAASSRLRKRLGKVDKADTDAMPGVSIGGEFIPRHQCRLYPVANLKLLQNIGHIVFDGFLAQPQFVANFLVAETARNKFQNLLFP